MSMQVRRLAICVLLCLLALAAVVLNAQTTPPDEHSTTNPVGILSPTPQETHSTSDSEAIKEPASENRAAAATTSTPTPDTCLRNLPAHIVVSGADSSTQCSLIAAGSVHNDEIAAAGVNAAVDIWGWTSSNVNVCFRGSGRVAFLDATTAPRALSYPAATVQDGMTCIQINGPGTVALTGGTLNDGAAPAADALTCQVTTLATLYVRAAPGGPIVEITLPGTTLTATEYAQGWYKVRYWIDGWVSAAYVTTSGDCQ